MIADIHIETRNAVVLRHATRLEVLESLMKERGQDGRQVSSVLAPDRDRLRLIVSITGDPGGDNGLVMVTAPNRPEYLPLLKAAQLGGYAENPTIEQVPTPCRS